MVAILIMACSLQGKTLGTFCWCSRHFALAVATRRYPHSSSSLALSLSLTTTSCHHHQQHHTISTNHGHTVLPCSYTIIGLLSDLQLPVCVVWFCHSRVSQFWFVCLVENEICYCYFLLQFMPQALLKLTGTATQNCNKSCRLFVVGAQKARVFVCPVVLTACDAKQHREWR